mmetsp:Transcript_54371/g.100419  ORF Transcript_54371/g.100419 Transcript_54371/m.100419 type:complete len:240 (-) Transcript_54371:339-1058(-)
MRITETQAKAPPIMYNSSTPISSGVVLFTPSMFGKSPARTKRTTCTVRKDPASDEISFSASSAASWNISYIVSNAFSFSSSSPSFTCLFFTHLRSCLKVEKRTITKSWFKPTGIIAVMGEPLKMSRCCIVPPALIAAKPAMWAIMILQLCTNLLRLSNSICFFSTGTSKPRLTTTLFSPPGLRTFSSPLTGCSKSARKASAMTHWYLFSSLLLPLEPTTPDAHAIMICKARIHTNKCPY